MLLLPDLSRRVRSRRSEMGLTQADLARISGLSRATVNALEAGSIEDLSVNRVVRLLGALGFSLTVSPGSTKLDSSKTQRTPPLELAARTASVSYKHVIPVEDLTSALLTKQVPHGWLPHVCRLLEEGSVQLLAGVVDQLHTEHGVDRPALWSRMRSIARSLGIRREIWL